MPKDSATAITKSSQSCSSIVLTDRSFQVICEKVEKSDIATIDKKKYLVPADLTVGQFVYVIRKRIKLSPEKAIFIFVDEVLPPTAALMSAIYSEHASDDGFCASCPSDMALIAQCTSPTRARTPLVSSRPSPERWTASLFVVPSRSAPPCTLA